MKKITVESRYTKTYKTEENLNKALFKLLLPEGLAYLLYKVDGRYTAVFTNVLQIENGMYLRNIIDKGFKVVG